MTIRFIRTLIVISIALIVVTQVANWVAFVTNSKALGVFSVLATAVAYFFCNKKSRESISASNYYYLWILAPTALFSLLPIGYSLYRFLKTEDASLWSRIWDAGPVLLSFILPVALFLASYSGLGRHAEE